MSSRSKGDRLLRITQLGLLVSMFLVVGCTNPNPGLNFASRNNPDGDVASAVERSQNKEDLG